MADYQKQGHVTAAQEFVEFATTASPRLRRMAFLLCGDWHAAEDLVQTTLAKVFVSWPKIRRQDAEHAYAARSNVKSQSARALSKLRAVLDAEAGLDREAGLGGEHEARDIWHG